MKRETGRKVLITGVQGFTGRYLAAELQRLGHQVIGTGLGSSTANDYYQLDLADRAEIKRFIAEHQPEWVVHLAALAFVAHDDPAAFYQTNLIGSRYLLEALAAAPRPPQSVLLASSANVYGNATAGQLDESAPVNPMNDYAVSKLAMEHMARLWSDRLPLFITRPFNYTGAGQSDQFLLPKIVSHFRRRESFIELGNTDVARDFSDVRSVVDAYRRLLEVNPVGQTINICSGFSHTLLEVVDLCRELTGHDIEIKVNPAFVRAHDVKQLSGNPSRLHSLIGEHQGPGLKETLHWMLSN